MANNMPIWELGATTANTTDFYAGVTNSYWDSYNAQRHKVLSEQQQYSYLELLQRANLSSGGMPSAQSPKNTLVLIKKSIKEIKAEAVSGEAQGRIEDKILRLLEVGADAQAAILEAELRVRKKLCALQEWDYKVLPTEEIGRFENENRMTATKDGLKVHIDPLEKYVGNPQSGEAKDRIIPDEVLGKLEEAKERKLFDSFAILWVEKVKDPLLFGLIKGCKDFFLICEWGEDVKFDDIMKGK